MKTYTWRVDEDGIKTCHSCDSEAPLRDYDIHDTESPNPIAQKKVGYCEICASTTIATCVNYPDQYSREHIQTNQTMAVIGNMLLEQAGKFRQRPIQLSTGDWVGGVEPRSE